MARARSQHSIAGLGPWQMQQTWRKRHFGYEQRFSFQLRHISSFVTRFMAPMAAGLGPAAIARTADSMALKRDLTSCSPSPDRAQSPDSCVRLRHNSHRLLDRATPEKQIEYSEGLIFDQSLFPVAAAWRRKARS